MQQQTGALNVTQEIMSQTRAVRRALNQTRNIRQHNVLAVAADDAQIRRQRREVVIADFRLRARHDGQNRRFADVRIAHKTHVRNRFELQQKGVDFRLNAGLGEVRRLPGRGRKVAVAQPPRPPCRIVRVSPAVSISATTAPDSASRMTVPTGTLMMRSSPRLPVQLPAAPSTPFSAVYLLLKRKSSSVCMFRSA